MSRPRARTIPAVAKLARHIEGAWKRRGHRLQAFGAIAASALGEHDLSAALKLDDLLQWAAASEQPRDCDPFESPRILALTLWSNDRFFVNAYIYQDANIIIHNHDFVGAFMNLSGDSLHVKYAFDLAERPDPDVLVGSVLRLSLFFDYGPRFPARLDILRELERKYGRWIRTLDAVQERDSRMRTIDWRRLEGDDLRLFMALLVTLPEATAIREGLQRFSPGAALERHLPDLIRRLGTMRVLQEEISEPEAAALASVVLSPDAARPRSRETARLAERFENHLVLGPLLRVASA